MYHMISTVNIHDNELVSSGSPLFELNSQSRGLEVEIEIQKENVKFLDKEIDYKFSSGDLKTQGSFIGSSQSVNTKSSKIACLFRITKPSGILKGDYVKLEFDIPVCDSCEVISSNAVYKDSTVYVVKDSLITQEKISIIYSNYDKTYFTGLADSVQLIDRYTNSIYLGRKAQAK